MMIRHGANGVASQRSILSFGKVFAGAAAGVSLAALAQAQLGGVNGMNAMWNANHLEIIEQGVDTSELIPNSNFTSNIDGWIIEDTNGTVEWDASGAISLTGDTDTVYASVQINAVIGQKVRIEIDGPSSGNIHLAVGTSVNSQSVLLYAASNSAAQEFIATSTPLYITLREFSGTGPTLVSRVSAKHVDRSYSGPIANKITFEGTKKKIVHANGKLYWAAHNLLDYSEDFSQWDEDNCSASDNGDGTYTLTSDAFTDDHAILSSTNFNPDAGDLPIGVKWKVKKGTARYFYPIYSSAGAIGNQARVDLETNTVEATISDANHAPVISDFSLSGPDAEGFVTIRYVAHSRDTTENVRFGFGNESVTPNDHPDVSAYDADGSETIIIKSAHVFYYPADETYVKADGSASYGIPTEHDINKFTGSTGEFDIASSGLVTIPLTGSIDYRTATTAHDDNGASYAYRALVNVNGMSFRAKVAHTSSPANAPNADGTDNATWRRDDLFVRVSATSDVDGAWMLGRVRDQDGTSLTLEILKSVGSGSYDDWYVIAVKCVKDEPVAQNTFLSSTDLGNTDAWDNNLGLGSVVADGTLLGLTRWLITEDSTSGFHRLSQLVSVSSGVTYTQSAIVEEKDRELVIVFSATGFSATTRVRFDPSDGSHTVDDGSPENVWKIQLGAGIWLFGASLTATSNSASSPGFVGLANGSSDSYLGDGSSGLYMLLPQYENLPYPSSRIPTIEAAVERAADAYSVNPTDFGFNENHGWAKVKGYMNNNDTSVANEVIFYAASGPGLDYHQCPLNTIGTRTGSTEYIVREENATQERIDAGNSSYPAGTDILFTVVTSFDDSILRVANSAGDYDDGSPPAILPNVTEIAIGSSESGTRQLGEGLTQTIFGTSGSLTEAEARAMAA